MKIGQRVRSARQRLGISLEDLGELAEVSWTSIGKIERGAQSPNVETIVRLATALDVEPGTFLTGVTSDDYGQRPHRLTARDLINARAARDRVASDPDATAASQPAP
nr:helix-turn-helix transcriptional regulator [Leucobacter chromiireducens]